MSPEKTALLHERYPSLFAAYDSRYGIGCEDGWFALIDSFARTVSDEVRAGRMPADVTISYIKEKFGLMRLRFTGGDEGTERLAADIEAASARTCAGCGAPGVMRNVSGCVTVRCDACHAGLLDELGKHWIDRDDG